MLVVALAVRAVRTSRSGRTPRVAWPRRARPRGRGSPVPTFASAAAEDVVRDSRTGRRRTPSSSPTTQSPGAIRAVPIEIAHLCRRHVPAPGRVLGRDEPREDGEAELRDQADVPAAAVDHAARDAARGQRGGGQLAEVGRAVVVALVHGDMIRSVRRRASPACHGSRVSQSPWSAGSAEHRERLPGEAHTHSERPDRRWQRLRTHARGRR